MEHVSIPIQTKTAIFQDKISGIKNDVYSFLRPFESSDTFIPMRLQKTPDRDLTSNP